MLNTMNNLKFQIMFDSFPSIVFTTEIEKKKGHEEPRRTDGKVMRLQRNPHTATAQLLATPIGQRKDAKTHFTESDTCAGRLATP